MDKLKRYFFTSILIILLTNGMVRAQDVLHDTKITLNLKDVPLVEVLRIVEEQTGIQFSYAGSLIPSGEKSTISVKVESIDEILKRLFNKYNIMYAEYGDHIIIKKEKGKISIYKTDEPKPAKEESRLLPTNPPIIERTDSSVSHISSSINDGGMSSSKDTIINITKVVIDTIPGDSSDNLTYHFGPRIRTTMTYTVSVPLETKDSTKSDSSKTTQPNIKPWAKKFFSVGPTIAYIFPYTGTEEKTTNDVKFSQRLGYMFSGGIEGMYHLNRWGLGLGARWTTFGNNMTAYFSIDTLVYKIKIDKVDSFNLIEFNDTSIVYVTEDNSYFIDTTTSKQNTSKVYYHYLEFPITLNFDLIETDTHKLSIIFSYVPGIFISSKNPPLNSSGYYDTNADNRVSKFTSAIMLGISGNIKMESNWEIGPHVAFKKYMSNVFVESYYPRSKGYYVNMGIHFTYNILPKKKPAIPIR